MSLTKFLAPDGTTVQVASAANPLPVVVAGGGAGGATLAEQQVQTGLLGDIETALTTPVAELPPRPLRTDVANFPTRTLIEVSGADTDELLPTAGAGKRQFVYSGWLQTDIDCVITFKSNTTEVAKPISLKAGDLLKLGAPGAELPELYTGVNEPLNLTKSTAATIKGVLFSKAA